MAQQIRCPFLVTHGEPDRQVPVEDADELYEAAPSGQKELKVFTEREGGSARCRNDNRILRLTDIADRPEDALVRGRRRRDVQVGEQHLTRATATT